MIRPDTSNVYRAGWSKAARAEAGYGEETKAQTVERLRLAAPESEAAKKELERLTKKGANKRAKSH